MVIMEEVVYEWCCGSSSYDCNVQNEVDVPGHGAFSMIIVLQITLDIKS